MQYFYYVFGVIAIAAAVQGALAGSMISLIAGGILGALILAGGALLGGAHLTLGLVLALIGSLGIAGKFVPTFIKNRSAVWPAGVLALLSVLGILGAIVGFLG